MLVRLVVEQVSRGADFLQKGASLALQSLRQVGVGTLANVMNRECLAYLGAIEIPELTEKRLPEGILLDSGLL